MNIIKNINYRYALAFFIILLLAILKAIKGGHDVNVYLYASKQLFLNKNIYGYNPYNSYLYSPLFALILYPLSILDFKISRIIWAIINVIIAFRLWNIFLNLIKSSKIINSKVLKWLGIGVFAIGLDLLNLNFILGQMTIIILWTTFEGLYQILDKKKMLKGVTILALGINIKIIPLIGLFYLFFKGQYKTILLCIGFIILTLLLPSIFVGNDYNMDLLLNWSKAINPSNNKFVFENNRLTQSLSAVIPAYFYDFKDSLNNGKEYNTLIYSISEQYLKIIINVVKVIVLLFSLLFIFYKKNTRDTQSKSLYFIWELSYIALVSALIFPHQQKYAMLYFMPAGAYVFLYIVMVFKANWNIDKKDKFIASISLLLLLFTSFRTRDIIGNNIVLMLDNYHTYGLVNFIFIFIIWYIKPEKIIKLNQSI